MKIVKLIGGLGNQMFQYAFYLSLLNKGFDARIDIDELTSAYRLHNGYELERIFAILPKYASKAEVKKYSIQRFLHYIKLSNKHEFIEKQTHIYDDTVYLNTPNYYIGYWQNEKYFLGIRSTILEQFTFSNEMSNQNSLLLNEIKNSNSVSIHVRRGDYLSDASLSSVCTADYYMAAIKKIQTLIDQPRFFVFSDDVTWCKGTFANLDCKFVDWNKESNSYFDMQLMSNCKHNIIANSSFSWWGAWLNTNPNKVIIAPSKWVGYPKKEDIIPLTWITI